MFRKLRFDFRRIVGLRSWRCFAICSFGFYLRFFFVIMRPRGSSVSTLLIRKEFRTTTTTVTRASAEKYTMTYSGKCQKVYKDLWVCKYVVNVHSTESAALFTCDVRTTQSKRLRVVHERETVGSRIQGLFKTLRLQRTKKKMKGPTDDINIHVCPRNM